MKRLLLALLFVPTIQAMELIPVNNVSSADRSLKLYTNHKDMFVEDENAAYRVEKHNMNKELRDVLAHKALSKFKEAGYIRINQDDHGKYTLAAKVRGEGGGPLCAWWAYCFAKGTIYGTMGIAAGAAIGGMVAATGGTAVAPIAAGVGAATGKAIGTGVGMATVGSSISAGIASAGVAGATVNAVGAATVGTVAGGVAGSTAGAFGVVATVEGASIGFAALFAGPWCP